MPTLTKSNPKYRKHRASGQAIVTIDGKDYYLGPHGTKASRAEYDRLIAEWLAGGRRLAAPESDVTIVEMLAAFRRFAVKHYRKDGQPTRSLDNILDAVRPLKHLFGRELVGDFGPLKLKAVQGQMVRDGLSRGVVNARIGKIKRVFKWAVSEELAPASLAHALATVEGLQRGRTDARETTPIKPVDDGTVDATLPHLPHVVADMVRLQRLTGCRPGEVCILRPVDVDRTGDVWTFRPESHKTQHHGRERTIFIGPQAQDVLRPYLLRDADAYCFSPADSERKRHAQQREERRTPVRPSQWNRGVQKRKRHPRESYDKNSYRRAIERACELAFGMPAELRKGPTGETPEQRTKRLQWARQWRKQHTWHPNRLRHTAATKIRQRFGLEAAQVLLGHSKADVTQIYAERDNALGLQVAKQIG